MLNTLLSMAIDIKKIDQYNIIITLNKNVYSLYSDKNLLIKLVFLSILPRFPFNV